MFNKSWEYARDVVGDGYKIVGIVAPLFTISFTAYKLVGGQMIDLRNVSYAWAFLPIVIWLLIAYTRRRAAHLEMIETYLTSRATRDRIEKQLAEYVAAGETMIDTPTAAAVWAGTMETGDIQRHLYFRMIKLAVDNGTIKNAKFSDQSQRANMYTKIPLDEFKGFLKAKGVLA